jgi:hypothetical protein
MDPECSVGEPPLKTLCHPAKNGLDCPLGRRAIRRGLLCNNPQPIDEHLPRSLRSEDFAPVVEDRGRFAIAGPVVLAPGLENQAIFRLKCHFDQAHVVFFNKVTQGNDRTHDRRSLDTHQHGGMDTAGNRHAILGDHIQFHDMFVHLSQLGWCRNGEGERRGRLPLASRALFSSSRLAHLWLLLQCVDIFSHLVVGRKHHSGSGFSS